MSAEKKRKTAIVVGAGVGGVSSAARLAKAGFDVTVLEKNDFTGGRCSLIHHDGHRFDQGPSLLLLPKLFRETFHDLGTTLEAEGVRLLKCEPNYHLWFGDGESFELSSDTAVMKREIERWEGKDGFRRYLAWLAEAHRHYEISVAEVLHKNFPSIFNLARWSFLSAVFALHPFESIYSRAARYFKTERLRRVFTFGSMYMGMSPFDAPGTYSLLQYTELAEGIWYPVGGFHAVVAALVRVGERMGVKYRLSTPVDKVILGADGKTVTGVRLLSGDKLSADVVVINADLVYAYNNLFPSTKGSSSRSPTTTTDSVQPPSAYASSLSKRAGSCSSISFYWSLSRQIPELQVHNIFLADEYRESFDSIFKRQSIPTDPSFYVNVPSRIDPSAAPPGQDSVVILVPVGHFLNSKIHGSGPASPSTTSTTSPSSGSAGTAADLHAGHEIAGANSGAGLDINTPADLDAMISLARRTILATIKERTGADLAPAITHEVVNSPLTWEAKFNLDKGSILGLSHSFFNVLAFRPALTAKGYRRCYFVGASTHPGTGVPIVLAGAKLTVTKVLQDEGVAVPALWSRESWEAVVGDQGVRQDGDGVGKGGKATVKEIDRVQIGPVLSNVQLVVLVLLLFLLGLVMVGSGRVGLGLYGR